MRGVSGGSRWGGWRSILFGLSLLGLVESAWALTASGRVVDDRDADGRAERDEPGLPGVKVSNGREVVVTDAAGRYRLAIRDNDTVFVIKPAGFAVPRGADGLPQFWRHHRPGGSTGLRYGGMPASDARHHDFALTAETARAGRDAWSADGSTGADPATADDDLHVLVFGDPQPKTRIDVDHYARDIIAPLIGRHPGRFGISLGDIVHDDLSLYPALNQATTALGVPWLHAAGNHDLDFDAGSDAESLLSFRATFGPDTFAWEEAAASFIVLDDVIYRPGETPAYVGGLRPDQFAFLESYLSGLAPDRRIVIAAHIPLFDPIPGVASFRAEDRQRLFAVLRPFHKVLLLTAHGHVQRHYFHGPADGWQGGAPLHEYNVGATCGSWWNGPLDAEGIPDATMADGTPNGHAILTITADGGYRLRWQVARGADDDAIALYAPKVLRRGGWPGVPVVANVFMGVEGDRVEARIDDGPWLPMTRIVAPDPRLLAENLIDDRVDALRGYERLPQAVASSHLWRLPLPTDLALGEHRIEVRAFDRWQGERRATAVYRLDDYGR